MTRYPSDRISACFTDILARKILEAALVMYTVRGNVFEESDSVSY